MGDIVCIVYIQSVVDIEGYLMPGAASPPVTDSDSHSGVDTSQQKWEWEEIHLFCEVRY